MHFLFFIILHFRLNVAFSVCEALPSNALGGATQILAVVVAVVVKWQICLFTIITFINCLFVPALLNTS